MSKATACDQQRSILGGVILLPILFESGDLLVIDKPSGLAVHRGLSQGPESVLSRLRDQGFAQLFPVHRLDRPTSGVLLLAKNADSARFMSLAFTEKRIQKHYWAFVRGVPSEPSMFVDHPVPKDEGAERVPAQTHVRCLATAALADSPLRERRISWLEARPETGRFHQIRRHTKHIGCPILGDTTYGRSEHNRLIRARFGLARLALHACRLEVPLCDGGRLVLEAPLPPDLLAIAAYLGALDGKIRH